MNLILPKLYHKDLKSSQREKTTDLKNGSNKWASQRYCGASLMKQGENDGPEELYEIKGLLNQQKLRRLTSGRPSGKGFIENPLRGLGKCSQKHI